MIVSSIRVQNFRSLRDATLDCNALTAIVGANGVGKSTFLRALQLFYTPAARVTEDDFYAGDSSKELVVAITYRDLSAEATPLFAQYTEGATLTVERVFQFTDGRSQEVYFGKTLRHSPFQQVRSAFAIKDRAKTAKAAYASLRVSGEHYGSLPDWSSLGEAEISLSEWERGHPELCVTSRDSGQFFGFNPAAPGFLGRFTRLLYIPAVREASEDAQEGRGSVLTSLMDLLVRDVVSTRPDVIRLKERSQILYQRKFSPGKIPQLRQLGQQLTNTLRTLVPDASVELTWLSLAQIELPPPTADVKVVEEGYATSIERTGHGVQRAFIMTVLQHLAMVKSDVPAAVPESRAEASPEPHLVLAIEEPELYQHPNRQRHFAHTLQSLAVGTASGVAKNTQVLYGTHSPLFVSIEAIHNVRLLRRVVASPELPKVTSVEQTTLEAVAKTLWDADGQPSPAYTAATVLARLKSVMSPTMSEGFFAEVAVLVEGEDDRAALLGVADFLGYHLDSKGVSIIPCGGKTCLDRPFTVFTKLSIPVYLIWDGDKGSKDAKPADNHRLLRLLGEPETDWPSEVADRFACFETDLETTLRLELTGEVYDSLLVDCQQEFNIPKKKHAQKNPSVVTRIIERAHERGASCQTIEAIVHKLNALR